MKHVQIRTTGSEKTCYTVALAVTYTGQKLPAMLIWPSQGKKTMNGPVPDNVYLAHRPTSWMDTELMKKWVNDILSKRTRKLKEGKKGLVIFDGFRAHLQDEVTKLIAKCNFDVKVLPPYTTPHLQPLDIAVNRVFKSQYSQRWEQWISKRAAEDRTRPSKDRVIEWVSKAWEGVSEENILNGWRTYTEYHQNMRLQGKIP